MDALFTLSNLYSVPEMMEDRSDYGGEEVEGTGEKENAPVTSSAAHSIPSRDELLTKLHSPLPQDVPRSLIRSAWKIMMQDAAEKDVRAILEMAKSSVQLSGMADELIEKMDAPFPS